MVAQLSAHISLNFRGKRPFQKSVKEPAATENKYHQKARKTDTSGENPLTIVRNCSDFLGIFLYSSPPRKKTDLSQTPHS